MDIETTSPIFYGSKVWATPEKSISYKQSILGHKTTPCSIPFFLAILWISLIGIFNRRSLDASTVARQSCSRFRSASSQPKWESIRIAGNANVLDTLAITGSKDFVKHWVYLTHSTQKKYKRYSLTIFLFLIFLFYLRLSTFLLLSPLLSLFCLASELSPAVLRTSAEWEIPPSERIIAQLLELIEHL